MDVSPRLNPAYRLSPLLHTLMKRYVWHALLIAYAAAIFVASQLPVSGGEPPFPHFDKLLHAAEFAVFFALAWKATRHRRLVAYVMTAVYAGVDELHQLFVATRVTSSLDLAADLFGALVALLLLEIAHRLWLSRTHRILDRRHSKVEL